MLINRLRGSSCRSWGGFRFLCALPFVEGFDVCNSFPTRFSSFFFLKKDVTGTRFLFFYVFFCLFILLFVSALQCPLPLWGLHPKADRTKDFPLPGLTSWDVAGHRWGGEDRRPWLPSPSLFSFLMCAVSLVLALFLPLSQLSPSSTDPAWKVAEGPR